jgi:SAM-dependent methyltransferase
MNAKIDGSASRVPPEYYDMEDSDNVCYLCENPRYRLLHEVTHFGFPFLFKQCQCGLIKQTPMPNTKFFDWFFNSDTFLSVREKEDENIWGYYDFLADEACRLATSRKRYRMLRHLFEVERPLEVMKIGPATGSFLHVIQEHGHHAMGCDVSSTFVEYAKENYAIHIDQGRFEHQDYADGRFDMILLLNVIENVPNQVEFLNAINRTLKKDGHFILNFVNMKRNLVAAFQKSKYFLYRPPVCYAYTMPVMRRVLEKFGFRIVEVHNDIRYLHMEKIVTLLGWNRILPVSRRLRLHRLHFPIYAYPSKILVARKE